MVALWEMWLGSDDVILFGDTSLVYNFQYMTQMHISHFLLIVIKWSTFIFYLFEVEVIIVPFDMMFYSRRFSD